MATLHEILIASGAEDTGEGTVRFNGAMKPFDAKVRVRVRSIASVPDDRRRTLAVAENLPYRTVLTLVLDNEEEFGVDPEDIEVLP